MFKQILVIGLTSSFLLLDSEISHAQNHTSSSEYDVIISQEIPTYKKQLIDEYLELTGGEKTFRQLLQGMLSQMEQQLGSMLNSELIRNPKLSAQERQEIAAKFNQKMSRIAQKYNHRFLERIDYQQIVEGVYYPLYDKYFTEADLRVLIDFYQTPTGRKTIEVMPQLFQESMQLTTQVISPTVANIMQEIINEELEQIN